MLINLRGNSGSGKSEIALKILRNFPHEDLDEDAKGRANNYRVTVPGIKKPLFIIGRYETQCGGVDTIPTVAELFVRVDKYAKLGHVLFEGLLISSYWGSFGEWAKKYRGKIVFAYLDTPLEECLARVIHRRIKAGNKKPLNETNTRRRAASINATILRAELDRHTVKMISGKGNSGLKAVLELLQ